MRTNPYRMLVLAFTAALTIPAAAPAHADSTGALAKTTREYVDVDDCDAGANFVGGGGELGNANFHFDPHNTTIVLVKTDRGTWKASSKLSWTYNDAESGNLLRIPRWTPVTAAEKKVLKTYESALLAHENGHHKVAKDYMAAAAKTLVEEGATKAEAVDKLSAKADQYSDHVDRELTAKTRAYDQTTDHGRNQAALGGKNVELNCPA